MAPITLLYRSEWDALPPKWSEVAKGPVTNIFCGPTNREKCYTIRGCIKEMQYLQKRHIRSKGCPDIKYNFVIGCAGTIFEGRGWSRSPGLPLQYSIMNKSSIFIAFFGKFSSESDPMPPEMLRSLENLIQVGIDLKHIDPNYISYDL